MGARELMGGGVKVLASAQMVIASAAATAFDFGTPNDIYLPGTAAGVKASGDRLLLVLTAKRASGTTDSLAFTIQDADSVSPTTIGTPATAVTDGTSLVAAKADELIRVVGIMVQTGRPWIRVICTHSGGGSDSYQVHATLLGFPTAL